MDAFEVLQSSFSTLRSAFAPMRWIKSSRRSTRVSVSSRLRLMAKRRQEGQSRRLGMATQFVGASGGTVAVGLHHFRCDVAKRSGGNATARIRSSLAISRKRFRG